MDDDQYSAISKKLDRLIALLAITSTKGLEPDEQIRLLSSAGFQPMEIAPVVGKTPNAISIALHRLRKKTREQQNTEDETTTSEEHT